MELLSQHFFHNLRKKIIHLFNQQHEKPRTSTRREEKSMNKAWNDSSSKTFKQCGMLWTFMASDGTGSPMFINDVTEYRSCQMNSEMYGDTTLARFSRVQPRWLDGFSEYRWTISQRLLWKQSRSIWKHEGEYCTMSKFTWSYFDRDAFH